jgi:hypothetical protein
VKFHTREEAYLEHYPPEELDDFPWLLADAAGTGVVVDVG